MNICLMFVGSHCSEGTLNNPDRGLERQRAVHAPYGTSHSSALLVAYVGWWCGGARALSFSSVPLRYTCRRHACYRPPSFPCARHRMAVAGYSSLRAPRHHKDTTGRFKHKVTARSIQRRVAMNAATYVTVESRERSLPSTATYVCTPRLAPRHIRSQKTQRVQMRQQ